MANQLIRKIQALIKRDTVCRVIAILCLTVGLAIFISIIISPLAAIKVHAGTAFPSVSTPSATKAIWILDIRSGIGPATADYFNRGLNDAVGNNAQLLILRIDTPGGLDKSMRDIIKAVLASPIPVATFVAPSGARAASAGTYILYASHIAAMAPATNIGAATPVAIGSPGFTPEKEKQGSEPKHTGDAMTSKIVNDAVAYIEGLAELRGRNKDWAASAVTSAESISALAALEEHVIEYIAQDLNDLLRQLDGIVVQLENGTQTLATKDAHLVHYQANWRTQFLATITDPSIAYILLLIGIYGLVLEFYSPGMVGPGIVGAISLLVAMYALQMLPINYVGAGLILLGLSLMVAEAMAPSFGILGVGGVVAFVIGSIILIDTDLPGYQIATPIILAFATISVLCMVVVTNLLIRNRKKIPVSGIETLKGQHAVIETIYKGRPKIRLDGELWYASSDDPLSVNDRVEVVETQGMVLKVKKLP